LTARILRPEQRRPCKTSCTPIFNLVEECQNGRGALRLMRHDKTWLLGKPSGYHIYGDPMAGSSVYFRGTSNVACSERVIALHDETPTARTIALKGSGLARVNVAGQHVDVRLTAPDGYFLLSRVILTPIAFLRAELRRKGFELTVERLAKRRGLALSLSRRSRSRRSFGGAGAPNRRLVRVAPPNKTEPIQTCSREVPASCHSWAMISLALRRRAAIALFSIIVFRARTGEQFGTPR